MNKFIIGNKRCWIGVAVVLCLLLFMPIFGQAQTKKDQQRIDMPVRKSPKKSAVDVKSSSSNSSVEKADNETSKSKKKASETQKKSDAKSLVSDSTKLATADSTALPADTFKMLTDEDILARTKVYEPDTSAAAGLGKLRVFNPDPNRALWMSALCPGLGQIYNRRYWKLPIIVGAFVGLGYGTAWNNKMLRDYTKGYRDLTDNDPNTKSYMDFFPPTTKESDLDVEWLKKTFKNKRTYFRRYRDICVFSIIAVYLINIVDAYVDASLAHFDISPNLSMDVAPAVVNSQNSRLPSLGLQCAITF